MNKGLLILLLFKSVYRRKKHVLALCALFNALFQVTIYVEGEKSTRIDFRGGGVEIII